MKDLEWKDEYLLGIPEIDLQHKLIVECFVNVAEALNRHDRWLADSSMVQLVSLLQNHFMIEESLMRIIGYPELERHREEHRKFHVEVRDLATKSLRMKESVTHEMVKAIQKWLREHIKTSDSHYAAHFARLTRKSVAKKRGAQ